MTRKAGTFHDGELWLRCPMCGDSQRRSYIAHFSITTSGLYHCVRCNSGGRVGVKTLLNLFSGVGISLPTVASAHIQKAKGWETVWKNLDPGPGTPRASALDRYHLRTEDKTYDVFTSRNTYGEVVGLQLIRGKERRILGHRKLGWKGTSLVSSPERPLRLVEGPYDVLSAQDVCVYGTISPRHLLALTGHYVILCPDGDIWTKPYLLRSFLRCLRYRSAVTIVGVERLPDNKDPDEVPYSERLLLKVNKRRLV